MQVPELMNAYARIDTLFVRGEGTRLWDAQGKEYLDALSGIAVCGLGHAHPKVSKAICDQAHTLTHTSNLFYNDPQQRLAKELCALSGMDNVFFSNSGAEANEAALKIARKYGNDKGITNPVVITFSKSFHGRTMATLSATANDKVKAGFYPLLEGFVHAPYNDMSALHAIAQENPNIVAVFVEPVQGEGGVNVPADSYLDELRALCDANDWLLMLDEIQTGIGRTGKFLAYQHTTIQPDVVTLAKGLGNGFPIGACMAHGKAAQVIQPGNHGSTFGGNPLACYTAKTVLDTIVEENLIQNATHIGNKLISKFEKELGNLDSVVDIRGKGLMIGIELNKPCGELVQAALDEGLVLNVTAGNVIRLLPPLIFSDDDAEKLAQTVITLVKNFS